MAQDKAQGSGARTLSLLRCIAESPPEFGLKDLAESAGLPPSTVHRLLQVMLRWDIVERAGAQQYRVGRELFRIASLLLRNFDAHKIARPFLRALWTDWQETAVFCLYKPGAHTAVVAELIPTPHPVRLVMEQFQEISLPWGSLGRAILAQLPLPEVEAILADAGNAPISGKPLPPRRKVLQELETIAQRGAAIFQDNESDLAGISAPVFGPDRSVTGSIGLILPASRLARQDIDGMADAIIDTARRLSTNLGFEDKPRKAGARPRGRRPAKASG